MDPTEAFYQYVAAEKRLQRCRDADSDPTGTRLAEYAVDQTFGRWLDSVGLPRDPDVLGDLEPAQALPLEHDRLDAPLQPAAF